MTKEPTTEEMLDYLRDLYLGTHYQYEPVGDTCDENAQLKCHRKWCWSRYQAIRHLIEQRPTVTKELIEKWGKQAATELREGYLLKLENRQISTSSWFCTLVLSMLKEAGIEVKE